MRFTNYLPTVLLSRHADSWLMSCEIGQFSAGTIANRRAVVTKLQWFLETKKHEAVDVHSLRAFFVYLTNGHKEKGGRWGNPLETNPNKPGTIGTYHRVLKTFFRWLVAEGELEVSPMERIPPPVDRPDQINLFTEEQAQALLKAAARSRNPKRGEAILDTGARSSEVCKLNVGDADLTGQQLAIRSGKGGKSRYTPFSRETKHAPAYNGDYVPEGGRQYVHTSADTRSYPSRLQAARTL